MPGTMRFCYKQVAVRIDGKGIWGIKVVICIGSEDLKIALLWNL